MFEELAEPVRAVLTAGGAAHLVPPDEPAWADESPELTDAECAWLFDDAPLEGETTVADHVARVLAAGQGEAMTPALVAQLASVDPRELAQEQRVSLAAGLERARNHLSAVLAETVAVSVGQQTGCRAVDGSVLLEPEDVLAAEYAAALRLGARTADALVDVSVGLGSRLSATLAAMRCGDVSWDKAASLFHGTRTLTDDKARAVEARVLPAARRRTSEQHRTAVRRAVDRIDPEGAAERQHRARADVELIRTHYGDGVASIFARMPAEQADLVWAAAEAWARRRKAAGDGRTLDQLRVGWLVQSASSFLTGTDDDVETAPTRHGRSVLVRVLSSLGAMLGATETPAELADSGATISAERLREMLAAGGRIRRMLVDADSGELVDLTPRTWRVKPSRATGDAQESPFLYDVVIDTRLHHALLTGDVTALSADDVRLVAQLHAAIDAAPSSLRDAVRAMLEHPVTAADLDSEPTAYPVPARLAEFVATRDRHPANPAAGMSAASAGDIDHTVSVRDGGETVRDNLVSLTRRWHVLRTHGGWTYRRDDRGWVWTSPFGRRYRVEPHDYRLGP